MNPLASIVLVTKNGGDDIRALVAALARQRTDFPIEIIAVDSGSTDGTADWLEQSPVGHQGRPDRAGDVQPRGHAQPGDPARHRRSGGAHRPGCASHVTLRG
jgi:GT2 family glycosyltransferase